MHWYHGGLVVACQTDLVDALVAERELVTHARCPSCQVECRLHLTVWKDTWVVVIYTLDAAVAGAAWQFLGGYFVPFVYGDAKQRTATLWPSEPTRSPDG